MSSVAGYADEEDVKVCFFFIDKDAEAGKSWRKGAVQSTYLCFSTKPKGSPQQHNEASPIQLGRYLTPNPESLDPPSAGLFRSAHQPAPEKG